MNANKLFYSFNSHNLIGLFRTSASSELKIFIYYEQP
jgi:hypothetical protein